MIDHLIEENDLMKDFVKFNLEDDITFIKELIDGPPENKVTYRNCVISHLSIHLKCYAKRLDFIMKSHQLL